MRQNRHSQSGRSLIILSLLAPLASLALPWDSIKDKKLAEEVERLRVGSATELEWGFEFPLAYLLIALWLCPVACALRETEKTKTDLLVSFLPLLFLLLSGSIFGTNWGPLLCLVGALSLPFSMAKLHLPQESAFGALSSMLAPVRKVPEVDEEMIEEEDAPFADDAPAPTVSNQVPTAQENEPAATVPVAAPKPQANQPGQYFSNPTFSISSPASPEPKAAEEQRPVTRTDSSEGQVAGSQGASEAPQPQTDREEEASQAQAAPQPQTDRKEEASQAQAVPQPQTDRSEGASEAPQPQTDRKEEGGSEEVPPAAP